MINLLKNSNYNFASIFLRSYRFGISNNEIQSYGANYNPNALGLISIISISGLLQLNIGNRVRKIDLMMIGLLLFFGFLTMSRSFLLCTIVCFIMFICAGKRSFDVKLKKILVSAAIMVGVYFILKECFPYIYNRILARLLESDISNGRIELFGFYNNHIFSSFKHAFFGVGMQDLYLKMHNIYGSVDNVCHNGIQEIIVVWGIPGLIVFIIYIITFFRASKTNFRRTLTNLMPLFLIFVSIQTGQLIRSGDTLLELAVGYISLCVNMGNK
jgi:hypothetical protein